MSNNKESNHYERYKHQRPKNVLKEIMLKILIIGDYGVGKTSIVRRYTEGKFTSNYKITIGADFSIKTISWDPSTQVNMQLWDIAGHERLGFMTRVYYKYAVAAIIVFDLSRMSTLQSVQKWLVDVRDKVTLADGTPIPIIILANKCDISDSFQYETLNKFCKQHGVLKWYKTSAKSNINIEEAMMFLVTTAMKNKLKEYPETNDNIILHRNPVLEEENNCCR